MKQIKATGQCPITGQNLEEDDLIAISGRFGEVQLESGESSGTLNNYDDHGTRLAVCDVE